MPELVMQSQGKEAWSNKNWYDKRDSLELRLSFFLILGAEFDSPLWCGTDTIYYYFIFFYTLYLADF